MLKFVGFFLFVFFYKPHSNPSPQNRKRNAKINQKNQTKPNKPLYVTDHISDLQHAAADQVAEMLSFILLLPVFQKNTTKNFWLQVTE